MNTYQKIDTMHPVFRLVFAIALIMSGTLSVKADSFSYTYEGTTLNYETSSDNTCYVSRNRFISGDIIIPENAIYNGKGYSVTAIGLNAFQYCYDLTSVTIPTSVTSIGDYAFEWISCLTSVTIPNSVTSIGEHAFNCCNYLNSVTIGNSVTSIGKGAFYNCVGLTSVKIYDVNNWSKIDFGDINANPISCAHSFTVGDSDNPVRHLDLDLGDEGVSDYAFFSARNLETVRVKGGSIGYTAFYGCQNLRQICIDVDLLSSISFDLDFNVGAVYSLRVTPPAASDDTFAKYKGVKLYVPKGSVSEYENTSPCWWRFSDINESDFSDLDSIFKADYGNNEGGSGIDEIFMNNNKNEIDPDSLYEVYDLNGCKLGNSIENLAPGIYLIRQGEAQKKIAVK